MLSTRHIIIIVARWLSGGCRKTSSCCCHWARAQLLSPLEPTYSSASRGQATGASSGRAQQGSGTGGPERQRPLVHSCSPSARMSSGRFRSLGPVPSQCRGSIPRATPCVAERRGQPAKREIPPSRRPLFPPRKPVMWWTAVSISQDSHGSVARDGNRDVGSSRPAFRSQLCCPAVRQAWPLSFSTSGRP